MSDRTLNDIMCLALTDSEFRHNLLTDVVSLVEGFDLDPEERDILKAIKAESVTEFAGRLHSWMLERGSNNGHWKAYESSQPKNLWDRRLLFLESTY